MSKEKVNDEIKNEMDENINPENESLEENQIENEDATNDVDSE